MLCKTGVTSRGKDFLKGSKHREQTNYHVAARGNGEAGKPILYCNCCTSLNKIHPPISSPTTWKETRHPSATYIVQSPAVLVRRLVYSSQGFPNRGANSMTKKTEIRILIPSIVKTYKMYLYIPYKWLICQKNSLHGRNLANQLRYTQNPTSKGVYINSSILNCKKGPSFFHLKKLYILTRLSPSAPSIHGPQTKVFSASASITSLPNRYPQILNNMVGTPFVQVWSFSFTTWLPSQKQTQHLKRCHFKR